MINNIVDIFRKQASQHRSIKAFYYNRNYELGSGKEQHPLFWLEDPIGGRNQNNTFTNSVNFAVLFIPDQERTITELQNLAFSTGLNIIERIKQDETSAIGIKPDWTYTTLRNYYDDNACGCRFSVNFVQVNMQNLCLIEDQFDENKGIEKEAALNNSSMKLPDNCEVFANKFPEFNIRTSKK
ncbi:hypothetical protein [Dysgonomonas sp. ZJ279]|uniref:hypothetical protein n=1 Tax=Dysgonomonas sp. ZJ279 TaxID=2709796 RepID=UPI0013EDD766|nr:hypothetical protein [Dysgonomonas sp. ZJ279]